MHIVSTNTRELRVWPDYYWQDSDEPLPSERSDDFRIIYVHARMNDEEVDVLARMAANSAPDHVIEDEVVYWMGG